MGIWGAVPHGMPFGIGLQELFGHGGSSEFPSQSGTGNPKREPGLKKHGKKNKTNSRAFHPWSHKHPSTLNPANPTLWKQKIPPNPIPADFSWRLPSHFPKTRTPEGFAAGSPQLDPQSRNFWEQQDGPGSDPKDPAWFPTRSWRIFLLSQLIFVPWTALAQLRMCSWALPWEEILPGEGLGGEDPKSRSGAAKKKNQGEPGDRDGDREGDTGGAGTPWSCVCDGDSLGTLEGTRVGQREVTDPPF